MEFEMVMSTPEQRGRSEIKQYYQEIKNLKTINDRLEKFSRDLKHSKAIREYKGGLRMRMMLINRCLHQFLKIGYPTRRKRLSIEKYLDLNIFLHQFYANLYGAVDNLTLIWFYEKNNGEFVKNSKLSKNGKLIEREDNKKIVNFFNKNFHCCPVKF